MRAPLVSILTPVYNRIRYIRDSLESSLAQTYANFELILIDNVSTDGTWEICQEYARRDSRIRLLRNETNIGGLRNWIRTCHEARGEFSKTNFSDDMIDPSFLAQAVPMMGDDVAFVVSPAEIGDARGNGQIRYKWKTMTGFYPVEDFLRATLVSSAPSSPGSTLHRTADLQKNLRNGDEIQSPTIKDFPVHAVGPDLLLQLLTATAYSKVAFIREPLALMRVHAGTMTAAVDDRLYDCYAQTRIWFGLEHGPRWYLTDALAGAWLHKMKDQRRWVAPGEIRRQFLCNPNDVSTAEIVSSAWNITATKFGNRRSS